jgi:hypothetical protein
MKFRPDLQLYETNASGLNLTQKGLFGDQAGFVYPRNQSAGHRQIPSKI